MILRLYVHTLVDVMYHVSKNKQNI